ncbi:MAG: arylesterase [Bacteroidota bacterium]
MNLSLLLALLLAVSSPEPGPKTVLFFGDSITAGFGIDAEQAFPSLIQKKVDALDWSFTIVNGGLSGETSAGGLRRIRWVLQRPIDVMILELGGNDGLRGIDLSSTKANLQSIVDIAKEVNPDMKIIIAGMQVPPNLGETYTTEFQTLYSDLAEQNNLPLIPFILEGVGGVPELNLPDGIHPTEEGHHIVAETVWKTLQPILKEL